MALDPAAAFAQIVINEIYPDPAGTDDPLERVEIYNAGVTAVDVTGWGIHDAASIDGSPALRCRLPEDFDTSTGCSGSAIIQPGEFRIVKYGPGTPVAWLNQGGDDIYLCSNRIQPPVVVHQVTYPSASGHIDEVWAAVPNGTSSFAWRVKSLCASNAAAG
ncbi:MAG: lamin tail domain-containing protein, partial [Candidatus Eisenbacteria bacterium]